MADDISASVPAAAKHVLVLRTVTASVAAQLGFSVDEIDDLRLAVDEAAAHVLSAGRAATTLTLRIAADGDRLMARLASDAQGADVPSRDAFASLSWQILTALVEDLDQGTDGSGPFVTFAKSRPRR